MEIKDALEREIKMEKKTREEVKREGYCGFWPSRCVTNIKGRFEFLAVVSKTSAVD